MTRTHITCLLAILLLAACEGKHAGVEQLHKETMDIHDDAMILITQMKRLGRALKQELSKQDSIAPERRESIMTVLSQMDAADTDMMNWMRDFKTPHGLKPEEALEYLNEQKSLIKKNHEDIQAAIAAAKQLANQ